VLPIFTEEKVMSGFWRRLFGRKDEFDFDDELAKLVAQMPPTAATPAAELRKPTRSSEEAKWPARLPPGTAVRTNIYTPSSASRKPKAPKRVANARPAAKSKTHKSRL
jgi:hypothetical protein